ncbi:class I SAM-dependent methyltransferase [Teichococcus oryzae]|uniref:Methyltransferase domain-containing protein n=1 Tax=Teichococcus oryzae TaxID=1608942 RepID=A0A5B2TBX2_9PROT|nr:class I SAM-dependent methyltransferase [Pseudoroseomonas oryzae]KAA2212007.1 methyltransferase domain-containing protein [Pseudoroseomonas oryzae]
MGEIFERTVPETPLEWTGERLTTAAGGQVEIEHLHRYFLARTLCRGRDVLDIACGEGYGSALMAQAARSVLGVDVSAEAVSHAAQVYARSNLRYEHGDARSIPLPDQSVDMVVSFETLEHFFEHDRFLEEVRRVLRPGGLLLLSSPERDVYSPPGSTANPYHVNELSRPEFERLLRRHFGHIQIMSQRPMLGSALVADDGEDLAGTLTFEKRGPQHYEASHGLPRPPYLLALASNAALPPASHSLFIETDQIQELTNLPALRSELHRHAAAHQELEHQCRKYAEQAETYERNAQGAEARLQELQRALEESRAGLQRVREEEAAARAGMAQRLAVLEEERAAQEERVAALSVAAGRVASLQAELDGLRQQRNLLRQALRQRRPGAPDEWRQRALAAEGEVEEWRQRALVAETEAAEWRQRYEGLRARLITILHRFQIHIMSRITPKAAKRFVRERLLGGGRQ